MLGLIKKLRGVSDTSITQEELKELVKAEPKTMIIDVRTYAEYRMDHINPCQNISLKEGDFDGQVKYLDKDKFYVLYCGTERRSKRAKKRMLKMGFDNVFTLQGGIQRWVGIKKVK